MPLPITPPGSDPVTPQPGGEAATSQALAMLQQLVMFYVLQGVPELAQRAQQRRWSNDTPEVARAAADVLGAVQEAFRHLPVTARSLRAAADEVERDAEFKQTLDKLQRWATLKLGESRTRLFTATQQAVDAIRTAKDSQLLSPDVRGRVTVAAGDLDELLTARSEGRMASMRDKRAMRTETQAQVAAVEEKLAQAELELAITRGASAPAMRPAPAANKRSARRARR